MKAVSRHHCCAHHLAWSKRQLPQASANSECLTGGCHPATLQHFSSLHMLPSSDARCLCSILKTQSWSSHSQCHPRMLFYVSEAESLTQSIQLWHLSSGLREGKDKFKTKMSLCPENSPDGFKTFLRKKKHYSLPDTNKDSVNK